MFREDQYFPWFRKLHSASEYIYNSVDSHCKTKCIMRNPKLWYLSLLVSWTQIQGWSAVVKKRTACLKNCEEALAREIGGGSQNQSIWCLTSPRYALVLSIVNSTDAEPEPNNHVEVFQLKIYLKGVCRTRTKAQVFMYILAAGCSSVSYLPVPCSYPSITKLIL